MYTERGPSNRHRHGSSTLSTYTNSACVAGESNFVRAGDLAERVAECMYTMSTSPAPLSAYTSRGSSTRISHAYASITDIDAAVSESVCATESADTDVGSQPCVSQNNRMSAMFSGMSRHSVTRSTRLLAVSGWSAGLMIEWTTLNSCGCVCCTAATARLGINARTKHGSINVSTLNAHMSAVEKYSDVNVASGDVPAPRNDIKRSAAIMSTCMHSQCVLLVVYVSLSNAASVSSVTKNSTTRDSCTI